MKLLSCVAWWLLISCLFLVLSAEDGLRNVSDQRFDNPAANEEVLPAIEAAPNPLQHIKAPEGPPSADLSGLTEIGKHEFQKLETSPESDLNADEVAGELEVDVPESLKSVLEDGNDELAVEEKEETGSNDETVEEEKVVETVVNDSNITAKANESGQGEDDIPSFNEWTQKVLAKEEKSGVNGESTQPALQKNGSGPKLRQKNYASPDCGAKVIMANPEAEHTSAILVPARDEYFLSPCSAKIWFVIELCEAIQAQKIDIANFELFSSSPKEFKVYTSDRFPTRDWTLLGQFHAVDERSVQSFSLDQKLFGKFVKVELMSHYGREHFCPISLFHVYGNSEYEVLDNEENTQPSYSTDEEHLDPVTTQPDIKGQNILNSAKDVVINIVKKAAEALGKGTPSDSLPVTNSSVKEDCHTAVQTVNVTRAVNGSLSCQWDELNFLASLPWLHSTLLNQCPFKEDSTFLSKELAFAQSIWGATTIQALCHWIVPETKVTEIEPSIVVEAVELIEEKNETEEPEEIDNIIGLDEFKDLNLAEEEQVEKPIQQQQQKESIFLRMANRIKTLEKNMSLSGQYLEELSKRYKKQVDDMQKTLNRTLQTLNETMTKMTNQEDKYQKTLDSMQEGMVELRSELKRLVQENLTLKSQMMESHLLLMLIEVVVTASVVVYLLRRLRVKWQDPPSSPEPDVESIQESNPVSEARLSESQLTLNVTNLSTVKKQQVSPTPSLAESSSSGCESAFSFAVKDSRDPSPVNENKPAFKQSKKQKKKKEVPQKRSLSTNSGVRLKSDNWEWHSRAKELAVQFIKENYDGNGALRV